MYNLFLRKNDFDLLTSSDLDLVSRSFKIKSFGPRLCPTIPKNSQRFD